MSVEKRIILYVLRKLRSIPSPGPATQALFAEIDLVNRILERVPYYHWEEIITAVFPLAEDEKSISREEDGNA